MMESLYMDFDMYLDAKRRKIANTESISMVDNNSLTVTSPATTESSSLFTATVTDVARQRSSQNCKMMPPCNMEHNQHQQQIQQQQQQQQHHHLHQQQPQPVITNTYNNNNNNMMMESANRTWPKDGRMAMTHGSTMQQPQHQQHLMNGNGHMQWSHLNAKQMSQPNMCPHQQRHCTEFNNNEQQQSSLYKDDLNGYLQHQTELVHNSMMDVQHHNDNGHNHEHDEDDEDDDEDDELGGEEEDLDDEEDDMDDIEDDDEEHEEDDEGEELDSLKNTEHSLDFLAARDCIRDAEQIVNDEEEEDGEIRACEDDDDVDDIDDQDDEDEDEEGNEQEVDATGSNTEPLEQTVIEQPAVETLNETRLLTNQNTTFYQMPNVQSADVKQSSFTNIPRLTAISHKYVSYDLKNQTPTPVNNQQLQQTQQNLLVSGQAKATTIKLVPTAQESPVSSSTVLGSRSTPDLQRQTAEANKKPEQVGAISTSNESPRPCTPSPAVSMESISSKASTVTKTIPSPMPSPMQQNNGLIKMQQHHQPLAQQQQQHQQQQHSLHKAPNQQLRIVRQIKNVAHLQQQVSQQQQRILSSNNNSRTTLTTIAGNRGAATTTTTTSSPGHRIITSQPTSTMTHKLQTTMQKLPVNNTIPLSQLQLQPLLRTTNDNTGNSQIIMTSTGQLIVMPSSNNKPHLQPVQQQQQVIIASGNATATTQTAPTTNLIIQQGDVLNNAGQLTATLQQQPNGGYIVSQPTATASTTTQLQPTTVILNSGQNLLTSSGAKVLTNTGNIIHAAGTQPILTAGNQLITAQAGGNATNVLGQQTVVLNTLPNGGYVIQQQQQSSAAAPQQQQYTTLDSQVVSQIVQQPDGTLIQNQPQRIIITSDLKRRTKKRKNSPSPSNTVTSAQSITTQLSSNIPNQTATLLQQHAANIQAAAAAQHHQHQASAAQPQVVQLTTATPTANAATAGSFPQQFQLGSTGIQGIVVSKPATATTTTQPQQILLQNGQIIQPMNLIGQQLILPTTGLVMGPDSTLLQIQNMGSCAPTANILTATTPQGTMMLRATSPQTNKSFISSTATGQQFIVGSNGQLSPIGQIYSTPMGLMMPTTTQHTTTPTATFVQHNGTIQVQQQPAQQLNATTTQHHVTLQALQQHQQNLNHVVNNPVGIVLETATSSTTSPNMQQSGNSRSSAASPPDTTTHSPRSPERPPSHRSGGSDMVQCVSSSEPDGGTVSPLSTDSRQSPSTTVCDKGIVMSTAYQSTNIYKPSEAKIRRVQTPPQYQVIGGGNGAAASATNTNIAGITNLTLHQHTASHNSQTLQQHHQQQQQQHQPQKHVDIAIKPDTHDSPQNSPTTTVMLTPPPPRTPTPLQQHQLQQLQQLQQQQQHFFQNSSTTSVSDYQQSHQQQRTPTKQSPQTQRNRNRSLKSSPSTQRVVEMDDTGAVSPSSSTPPLAMSLQRTFAVGELIWGPARGFPAWPGKVVKIPDNQQESVWVQWFGGGGRSNTEIMAIHLLQSLSEGLEAHHKAQKDTRKSRKLNSQLEKAIQEAMTELDRISATSTTNTTHNGSKQQPTSSTQYQTSPNRANKRPIPRTGGFDLIAGLTNNYTSSNAISTTTGSSNRPKPIRIAPAPPGGSPAKSSSTAVAATSSSPATSSSATATWVNSASANK